MDVYEHATFDCLEDPRAFDLARLEHDVAVGEDHRRTEHVELGNDVECPRVEPVGERVVDEPRRDPQHARLVRVGDPEALQRAEVVGVAELLPQLFEQREILARLLWPDLAVEIVVEILRDAIVVEQRVVDVEQEHDVVRHSLFSRWPPKPWRIAESTLFAKSPSPRDEKRSNSAVASTGAGTDSSIAASTVHRPSPESETRPV